MVKATICCLLVCCITPFLMQANTKESLSIDSLIFSDNQKNDSIGSTRNALQEVSRTDLQFREIGRYMGNEMKNQSLSKNLIYPFVSVPQDSSYKVARVYPQNKEGADVIYIDTIDSENTLLCITYVISGYIETAFSLDADQADVLAFQICQWNSKHYNEISYFKSQFEERVIQLFSNRTSCIGLKLTEQGWTNKTRIIIPVMDHAQKAAPVDATALSDEVSQEPDFEIPITQEESVIATDHQESVSPEAEIPEPASTVSDIITKNIQDDVPQETEQVVQADDTSDTSEDTVATEQSVLHTIQLILQKIKDNSIYTLIVFGILVLIFLRIVTVFSYI
ncbi:MAG: hypothetical protein K6E51_09115 [Treponema sp.]|nr:hypothetical protein [Treponema sp.]